MHFITLDGETDFNGWRNAARALALGDIKPADVIWRVRGNALELFEPTTPPPEPPHGATFHVSGRFIELAQTAILHRAPERFALLYRLLWRLRCNHGLVAIGTPPVGAGLAGMGEARRRPEHQMDAFCV